MLRASAFAFLLVLPILAGCVSDGPTAPPPAEISEASPALRAEGATLTDLRDATRAVWVDRIEVPLGTSTPATQGNGTISPTERRHLVTLPPEVTHLEVWLNWSDPAADLDLSIVSHLGALACDAPDAALSEHCVMTRAPVFADYEWAVGVTGWARQGGAADVAYEATLVVRALPVVHLGPPEPAGADAPVSFGPAVRMPTTERVSEPSIAVTPKGTIYVAAPDGRVTHLWRSSDAQTFENVTLPPFGGIPPDATPLSYGGDSDVVVVGERTVYVVGQAGGTAQQVFASHDGGATWSIQPLASGITSQSDRGWLVARGETDAWVVSRNEAGKSGVARSVDGGLTFPIKTILPEQACPVQTAAIAPSGMIVVAYCDANGPAVAVSTVQGLAFTSHSVAKRSGPAEREFCFACHTFLSVAVDAADRIYVAWSDATSVADAGAGTLHVWLARSDDAGVSWSAPVRVDGSAGNAVMPWVTAGKEGHIAVGYYATRHGGPVSTMLGDWYPVAAVTKDAVASTPTWSRGALSDVPSQDGPICFAGSGCGAGRGLADFFQIIAGPEGRLHAAFTRHVGEQYDDPGQVFAVRQTGGPMLGIPSVERNAGTGR